MKNKNNDNKDLNITYNSKDNMIKYKHKNGKTKSIKYNLPNKLENFELKLDINAYQLRSGGVKKNRQHFS